MRTKHSTGVLDKLFIAPWKEFVISSTCKTKLSLSVLPMYNLSKWPIHDQTWRAVRLCSGNRRNTDELSIDHILNDHFKIAMFQISQPEARTSHSLCLTFYSSTICLVEQISILCNMLSPNVDSVTPVCIANLYSYNPLQFWVPTLKFKNSVTLPSFDWFYDFFFRKNHKEVIFLRQALKILNSLTVSDLDRKRNDKEVQETSFKIIIKSSQNRSVLQNVLFG